MEKHSDGNYTKYIRTKSKECIDNNRTLVTLANDGAVSFIKMTRPMQSILLYPDQVKEFLQMVNQKEKAKT
jgi:hypothetical protein